MKTLAYDTDEKTVIGWSERGMFTPLPSAPEGAALDILVDQIAGTIEKFFERFWDHDMRKTLDRLDGNLKPREGTHSTLLLDGITFWGVPSRFTRGVRSWVTEGTLRDQNELTPVLNAFVAQRQLERRMHPDRVKKDWQLNDYDLATIGVNFGLPAPPTREQLRAEAEANQKAYEDRREREAAEDADANARMAQWEKEYEIKRRKKHLLLKMASEFFTVEDIDLTHDPVPPEYYAARDKRRVFCDFNRDLVSMLVDQGKTDDEVIERIRKMNAITKGWYESSVPDPLHPGETRHYVATAKDAISILAQLNESGLNETHIATIQLAMDGRHCVTIRPKTEEDFARDREIDGVAK